jgi:hypothetical protein
LAISFQLSAFSFQLSDVTTPLATHSDHDPAGVLDRWLIAER